MKKILIIEDDNDINNLIYETLKKNGYECTQAFSGTEGLHYSKGDNYSLIILDLMLPGMDGKTVLEKIREGSNVPVIIVSSKDEIDSKVDLLTSGAEDYITKPFNIKELLARVAVQIRINNDVSPAKDILQFRDLELNKQDFSVYISGNKLNLTKQELKILELLMSYPLKVFSKQDIYDYAWEEYYMGEDKTINVHIGNIRKKLKIYSDFEYIETVWGIGFKLSK